jgi:DNA-binding MarR family transcriptional regulator
MQDDRVRASLPHAVVRFFRQMNREHNRAFQSAGITAEQAHVLSILWELGPLTIGELQRELALSSPTLTGTIDRMEKDELVRRVRSPKDKRTTYVEPKDNATLRRKITKVVEETEHRCFAALSSGERRDLLRLLTKAAAGLEGATIDA